MTYNSTLNNKWKKANTYEIFLSAERNCHFSQVRFTLNLLMPLFMLHLTKAEIIPWFHQYSSYWQNQLRQLLARSSAALSLVGTHHQQAARMCCSIRPLSSSTTTSEEPAWEQGERVGTGRSSSSWLCWHMQWQWCTNTERHKSPWMPWPWEKHKALLMLLYLSWS